jgi:hypothetical protein
MEGAAMELVGGEDTGREDAGREDAGREDAGRAIAEASFGLTSCRTRLVLA